MSSGEPAAPLSKLSHRWLAPQGRNRPRRYARRLRGAGWLLMLAVVWPSPFSPASASAAPHLLASAQPPGLAAQAPTLATGGYMWPDAPCATDNSTAVRYCPGYDWYEDKNGNHRLDGSC